jgi:hypothetical protein
MERSKQEGVEGIGSAANLRAQVVEKLAGHTATIAREDKYDWWVVLPNPSGTRTREFPVKQAYAIWMDEKPTDRWTGEGVKFFKELLFEVKRHKTRDPLTQSRETQRAAGRSGAGGITSGPSLCTAPGRRIIPGTNEEGGDGEG